MAEDIFRSLPYQPCINREDEEAAAANGQADLQDPPANPSPPPVRINNPMALLRNPRRIGMDQEVIWEGCYMASETVYVNATGFLVSGAYEMVQEFMPTTVRMTGHVTSQDAYECIGRANRCYVVIELKLDAEQHEGFYVLVTNLDNEMRIGVTNRPNKHIHRIYLDRIPNAAATPRMLRPFAGPGYCTPNNDPKFLLIIVQPDCRLN